MSGIDTGQTVLQFRQNRQRTAVFDFPRSSEETFRFLQRILIHTTGQYFSGSRRYSVVRTCQSCYRIKQDHHIFFMFDQAFGALDRELRGTAGVRALLADPGLLAALDDLTAELGKALDTREAGVDDESFDSQSLERFNAAVIRLKDALWAIQRDRLRTARAVADLAGPDAGRAAVEGYTSVQAALSAIDRLEVKIRALYAELEAKFQKGPVLAGLTYGSYEAQPQLGLERTEGIVGSTKIDLSENYYVLGAARYNIETDKFDRAQVGAGYLDECFSFGLNYAVDFHENGNEDPVHKVFFRMSLRTLGETGSSFNVSDMVRRDN